MPKTASRPDPDPTRDADYDELVSVAAKLSTLVDDAIAAGYLPDATVVFDSRETAVMMAARAAAA